MEDNFSLTKLSGIIISLVRILDEDLDKLGFDFVCFVLFFSFN